MAPYDFDASDADVILVSGELEPEQPTQFRVHKCILASASPFFAAMFTLPQEPTTRVVCDLPAIPVSESHTTLDTLLRFVYPICDPPITSLDSLVPVLGAAVKYDFVSAISALRKLLVSPGFLQTASTRVYAIACRYNLEEEARMASKYTLSINILDSPLSEDLKYITAYAYHQLLDLHRQRARAAQGLLKLPGHIKCMQCNGSTLAASMQPKWWPEYEKRAREELAVRPIGDVIFGMEFFAKTVRATGCQRCAGSILDAHEFFEGLRRSIDNLPATI